MPQRYTVTVVAAEEGQRPTLLVPFEPSALVSAFVGEVFKRLGRQGGLQGIDPATHIVILHVDSETGAVVYSEDVLGDVVDPTDKLFAVLQAKTVTAGGSPQRPPIPTTSTAGAGEILIRVITPAMAQSTTQMTPPTFSIPTSATILKLHEMTANVLDLPMKFGDKEHSTECNCLLARQLAEDTNLLSKDSSLLIYGKSKVRKIDLPSATEDTLKAGVRRLLGQYIEAKKKLNFFGAQLSPANSSTYDKAPIVAICSQVRHASWGARCAEAADSERETAGYVLDLHTSEMPISPACMDGTLEETGIASLAVEGMADIFAVFRATSGSEWNFCPGRGKSTIFRSAPHWQPPVAQSDRGTAMFLSSLRVFAHLVEEMRADERAQDAVIHTCDLLFQFPPSIRALHVLINGRTPAPSECAALSHTFYTALDRIVPQELVGINHSRVFEGARLLFGFILEKARSLKLPEGEDASMLPYLSALKIVDVRDCKTTEPILQAVKTSLGLLESDLFAALVNGGLLHDSHLSQGDLSISAVEPAITRAALLGGGRSQEVLIFSTPELVTNYRYIDNGDASLAWSEDELGEMHHLSELCGRNKLEVCMPRQLAAAKAPCLTWDRKADLAVYTGEQACGEAGKSSLVFRPMHGTESMDTAIIEQLVSPLLQLRTADGTAVFDALGGAPARRMQKPDELLMFVVDTSASMRTKTDFHEVNDEDSLMAEEPVTAAFLTDPNYFTRASFENITDNLRNYESLSDMLAIIGQTPFLQQRDAAKQAIELLRIMLGTEVVLKHKKLESMRQLSTTRYYLRFEADKIETELDQVKEFWAGLQTHEDAAADLLLFQATAENRDALLQKWQWSHGDEMPSSSQLGRIPSLPADVTPIPDSLKCPITQALMLDAVRAADGFLYDRAAITRWLDIRRSSPMHGLPLPNAHLTPDTSVCDDARAWMSGSDLLQSTTAAQQALMISFMSSVGTFDRQIPASLSIKDLYRLAFRGLKARYTIFQLAKGSLTLHPDSHLTASACGVRNGDTLIVRLADEADLQPVAPPSSGTMTGDMCLIKVYRTREAPLFAYWQKINTPLKVNSIVWKYWRHELTRGAPYLRDCVVWFNLVHDGEGLLTGQVHDGTESLSRFLNRAYCHGRLSQEASYREGGVDIAGSQPLVMKVEIDRPSKPAKRTAALSRLDVLKQMFEAFINRMLAYNVHSHLGLITVGSTPSITHQISPVVESFRRATIDMSPKGDTALWNALALAEDQLLQYAEGNFRDARKRIVVISDGADTSSINKQAHTVYWSLKQHEVALDCICLGSDSDQELITIAHLLGCYAFKPDSLANAMLTVELEPFINIADRPDIRPATGAPSGPTDLLYRFRNARSAAMPTIVSEDTVPPRRKHPAMEDTYIILKDATLRQRGNSTLGGASSRASLRNTRLMNEMRQLAAGTHPKYEVYVSETDFSCWKIVMSGPDETPYAGTWLLFLHADSQYPACAPKLRFHTPIKHPNINTHGRICHSLMDRDWTSDCSMSALLDAVYGLLLQAETSDPLNTATTLSYHLDQARFAQEVHEHTAKWANKSPSQWKKEILGEEE